ncbi:MAG: ribosome-binding factor A [Candidatus Yanofskybacteria bacterium CG10_big_fil_rev_8_21_14_0_10_36_16]|uniref:Ribosome-binding factor A n=1 Tax=Candidatus Yanofskybacteria bacterium CG10_big_fil_rev_8_21_14_0_10_36_16 TaxID=1975096 RepID=A0A2J0Q6I6_9BACT|nr:MAG: ribosome-binding factor A [Candidatus Yanofskybacteria bacterium CG10_big_fil_rev_8_21_14_0_10_36_16]
MSERIKKVNALIRDEVSRILQKEVDFDEGVFVTVVGADVSPTLEHAKIKVSVFPVENSENVLRQINKEIFNIQQKLNKKLIMRKIPKIRFEIDMSEEYASHVQELLDNAD